MIEYRDLSAIEAQSITSIDRSEFIDSVYRVIDGALSLESFAQETPTWGGAQSALYVARLHSLLGTGGRVLGAWSGERLVGFASLDTAGVGSDSTLMLLDMLYVSRESRGLGIGNALLRRVGEMARDLGATSLYISATPTRGTVDAYMRMGAVLVGAPDPVLFEREPEDIHLELRLAQLPPVL